MPPGFTSNYIETGTRQLLMDSRWRERLFPLLVALWLVAASEGVQEAG